MHSEFYVNMQLHCSGCMRSKVYTVVCVCVSVCLSVCLAAIQLLKINEVQVIVSRFQFAK